MNRPCRHHRLGVSALGLAIIIGLAPVGIALATEPRSIAEALEWNHPAWFKESLLDLRADLQDARSAGKMGLLLVFGTRNCSYCQAFGATTLARPEIVARLRADFDVIGLEVMSDEEVVDFQGRSLWAKDFAVQEKARFTPTLVFYGEGGHILLRLVGYVPPARFSLVLDYLQGGWHERQGLRDFLAVREAPSGIGEREQLRDDPLLARSPQNLDRRQAGTRPLLVLFEGPDCPACERMHLTVLAEAPVRDLLSRFDAVQLDVTDARTPIVTPDGAETSPAGWGERLGLIHSPALVFFDERGIEVVRIDSDLLIDGKGDAIREPNPETVGNVVARLLYVLERGYLDEPQFQRWRAKNAREATFSGAFEGTTINSPEECRDMVLATGHDWVALMEQADGTRISRYETDCRRRHLSGGVLDGSKAPRHRSRILGADGLAQPGGPEVQQDHPPLEIRKTIPPAV